MDSPHIIGSTGIRNLIKLAIEEDRIHDDVTSALAIADDQESEAKFTAKEELIVCGVPLLPVIYEELGFAISISNQRKDGELLMVGGVMATVQGNTRQILSSERLCLNFLQHLSGIATETHKIIESAAGLKVLDTRKTTPGFRELEKYATKIGGASNHRSNLAEMVLIKNNHIDACGGDFEVLLERVFKNQSKSIPIEVEVRNMDELNITLKFKPARIMLDNMDNPAISDCVTKIRQVLPKVEIEVSGGVTPERLKSLATLGVDCASMGALTNKVRSVDISLRILND